MINIIFKYILWYEFLNDLDDQSDFDKKNCHKKAGQVEPFLSILCTYALGYRLSQNNRSNGLVLSKVYLRRQLAKWTNSCGHLSYMRHGELLRRTKIRSSMQELPCLLWKNLLLFLSSTRLCSQKYICIVVTVRARIDNTPSIH